MHRADWKERLRKRLRRVEIDNLWDHLVDDKYVDDPEETFEGLVVRARKVLKANLPKEPSKFETVASSEDRSEFGGAASKSQPTAGQERTWAKSVLVAAQAAKSDIVSNFRERHLDGGVIAWSNVRKWIEDQAAVEGPATNDIKITVEKDRLDYRGGGHMRFSPAVTNVDGFEAEVRFVSFALPGDRWVRNHPIRADQVLEELRRTAQKLTAMYSWQPAQAVVFVLADVVPLVSTVRLANPRGDGGRIVLDIDPIATADEVTAAFRSARRQRGIDHLRSLSPRHIRLAPFAMVEHAHLPWSERHRLWNKRFPDEAYLEESNFRKDAARTAKRLLSPDSEARPNTDTPSIFDPQAP